ncbi:TBC1 domain family member 25 [Orchesella cincta]|uniref:TBC1 domain family member 25 n=1 Tax=Orchesella cincta TaxID=48709 RepID=A0A1D2N8I5_ORCCI|nr:TBC1 domain family member 25 [Orchesella cincta]
MSLKVKFTHLNAHAMPPIPSLTSSYSKVCAIRRSSTALNAMDIRQRRYSNKKIKGNSTNLSLDENSLSSLSTSSAASIRSHRKPFYSLDESTEIISSSEFLSTSPFEILSPEMSENMPKPKMIKNLKEFWMIGRPKSFSSAADISPSTSTSFRTSTASSTYESIKHAYDADLNGQVFLDDSGSRSDEGTTPTEQCSLADSTKTYQCSSSVPNMPFVTSVRNLIRSENTISNRDSELSTSTESASKISGERMTSNSVNPASSSSSAIDNSRETSELNFNYRNNLNRCDVEGVSQGGESEHDSGHCLSESFENSVEPEFQTGATRQPSKMPNPETLGGGNPFLMFLCLTLLLQHRDHIMKNRMDYNETAMYFDKMIRKHNVSKVLAHARQMYSNYLKQNVSHA